MDARRRRADPDDEAQAQADLREVLGRDRGAVFLSAEEALQLAQEEFRRFNEGDFSAFWELQHPDIVMATDRHWPGGGIYRGREEFRRFLEQFLEAFETVRFDQVNEPEIVGGAPVFRGHWTGAGQSSGVETSSLDFSVVFWSRDGLISETRFFFEDDEAREHARSRT